MFFEVERSKSEFELIDTLWNVNLLFLLFVFSPAS